MKGSGLGLDIDQNGVARDHQHHVFVISITTHVSIKIPNHQVHHTQNVSINSLSQRSTCLYYIKVWQSAYTKHKPQVFSLSGISTATYHQFFLGTGLQNSHLKFHLHTAHVGDKRPHCEARSGFFPDYGGDGVQQVLSFMPSTSVDPCRSPHMI